MMGHRLRHGATVVHNCLSRCKSEKDGGKARYVGGEGALAHKRPCQEWR